MFYDNFLRIFWIHNYKTLNRAGATYTRSLNLQRSVRVDKITDSLINVGFLDLDSLSNKRYPNFIWRLK